jgi:hypothetical protein
MKKIVVTLIALTMVFTVGNMSAGTLIDSDTANITVDCKQENIFDQGDNCKWPISQTGSRCCCWCSDPTGAHAWGHVMDLGQVVGNVNVYFEIRPGAGDVYCKTTGYMYYSLDGSSWILFWSKPELDGGETYVDSLYIPDEFRYIRANTDRCSVDWCRVSVSPVS